MNSRIGVLIPAFNASRTLDELLRDLRQQVSPDDVLVVDDGSIDETAEVAASARVAVIRHARNIGKGGALRSGFRYFLGQTSHDAVVTMDADLQHSVDDFAQFVRARRELHANVVVGSRKIVGTAMPIDRRVSNILTSYLVSSRTGVMIDDSQCGYRLIGREVLRTIEIESDGFEAETEFLIKAARLRFHIVSVPIRTIYRSGESHMTKWATTKQFIRTLLREY